MCSPGILFFACVSPPSSLRCSARSPDSAVCCSPLAPPCTRSSPSASPPECDRSHTTESRISKLSTAGTQTKHMKQGTAATAHGNLERDQVNVNINDRARDHMEPSWKSKRHKPSSVTSQIGTACSNRPRLRSISITGGIEPSACIKTNSSKQ